MFTKNHLDEKMIMNLRKVNKDHSDGGCQFAAIEAAKVLLKKEYEPISLDSKTDFSEGNDPFDSAELKESRIGNCRTAEILFSKLAELKNNELFIVNGEASIDHTYIILKTHQSLWLIDADRDIYKNIKKPSDFIQSVSGWDEEERKLSSKTHLDYLRLKFVSKPSSSDEKDSDDLAPTSRTPH